MAQARNNENRFGGEYMIQDRDHMSEIRDVDGTQDTGARQSDQSQSQSGQQGGGDQHTFGQQGSERQRWSR